MDTNQDAEDNDDDVKKEDADENDEEVDIYDEDEGIDGVNEERAWWVR